MSMKLEKLREVNALITERCVKLETKIFIENSNSIRNTQTESKSSNGKTVIETKR